MQQSDGGLVIGTANLHARMSSTEPDIAGRTFEFGDRLSVEGEHPDRIDIQNYMLKFEHASEEYSGKYRLLNSGQPPTPIYARLEIKERTSYTLKAALKTTQDALVAEVVHGLKQQSPMAFLVNGDLYLHQDLYIAVGGKFQGYRQDDVFIGPNDKIIVKARVNVNGTTQDAYCQYPDLYVSDPRGNVW